VGKGGPVLGLSLGLVEFTFTTGPTKDNIIRKGSRGSII
jgi:hypothetical protein